MLVGTGLLGRDEAVDVARTVPTEKIILSIFFIFSE